MNNTDTVQMKLSGETMRTDEGLLKEEHDFLLGKTAFNMEQEKENLL